MLPEIALSVQQPWAWAIVMGLKDVENRTKAAVRRGKMKPGRIAVHASKTMPKRAYEDAAAFFEEQGVTCPAPHLLERGGIIGAVDVLEVVEHSDSPWFFGPCGLVLRNPERCALIPSVGALGYFHWKEADRSILPKPDVWMVRRTPAKAPDLLTKAVEGV